MHKYLEAHNAELTDDMLHAITLTAKVASVLSSSFGAYLIAQGMELGQFQSLSGAALASAAVCALWVSLKASYQARLRDKDEQIRKLEMRIDDMDAELKRERDNG